MQSSSAEEIKDIVVRTCHLLIKEIKTILTNEQQQYINIICKKRNPSKIDVYN